MYTIFKNCIRGAFLFPVASLFANFAYVGTSTSLSVINTKTNSVIGSISLGTNPILIAITPNNLFAYVTEISNDSIAVIDTTTNSILTTIDLVAGSQPLGIAITPNGRFAYVTNQGNNTVSVISLATNQVIGSIRGFVEPWGIAITPDGKFAYVVNLNGGSTPGFVTVIDLSSDTVLTPTIQVGLGPTGIAITPNGRFAYVTNENDNTVSVISIATNTLVEAVPVGSNPFEVAVNPNGLFVYVSNNAYANLSNSSVSVISTQTNNVVATISLGSSGPADLAVTPDGQYLYVTNTINTAVISTTTNQIIGFIPGSNTSSIAITATLITDLKGEQKINDFGVLYECFNHLEWQPTPYSDVIGYNVYRNGELIASLNCQTLQYDDHNQKKGFPVTYKVAPVEASGQESTPLCWKNF